MIEWTSERVGALETSDVIRLRENADRLGITPVVDLCDAALTMRDPPRGQRAKGRHHGQVVIGFHFVCPDRTEVTYNDDGAISTGTWVVARYHAERGKKIRAYVALHMARSEPSYAQGIIKSYEVKAREGLVPDEPLGFESGVVFTLEPTGESYDWIGDGSGERGYAWGPDTR